MTEILVHPHFALRVPADPAEDPGLLLDRALDLWRTLREHDSRFRGIGLAAPQVGWGARVAVVDVLPGRTWILMNPSVLQTSRETEVQEESCLSLPGVALRVRRPIRARLRAIVLRPEQDREALERAVLFGPEDLQLEKGLETRCALHELDHLDGLTIMETWIGAGGFRA